MWRKKETEFLFEFVTGVSSSVYVPCLQKNAMGIKRKLSSRSLKWETRIIFSVDVDRLRHNRHYKSTKRVSQRD
jgi:hypothetical protein